MTERVRVRKINESWLHVTCNDGIAAELSDHFKFRAPNYKFDRRVRNRTWDGFIRLFNQRLSTIRPGHSEEIREFCDKMGYELSFEFDDPDMSEWTEERVQAWVDTIEIFDDSGERIRPYDFQVRSVYETIQRRRLVVLSPTSSGKSLIIYLICLWILAHGGGRRVLVTVPRVQLVRQLAGDFADYSKGRVRPYEIRGGVDKTVKLPPIVISTWQSIYSMDPSWFAQFSAYIGDEAHTAKAKCLNAIVDACVNAPYRVGLTGTLDEDEVANASIRGVLGPPVRVARTVELIERGISSDILIVIIRLKYPESDREAVNSVPDTDSEGRPIVRPMTYHEEAEWLYTHERRTKFVVDLVAGIQNRNTIVLFKDVKNGHGLRIAEGVAARGRRVHYVDGGVKVDDREAVRSSIDAGGAESDVAVASLGTFSTGINIKNLNVAVLAAMIKSKIMNMQAIGRMLRKARDGSRAVVFHIVDDLEWRGRPNYALKHGAACIQRYVSEGLALKFESYEFKERE